MATKTIKTKIPQVFNRTDLRRIAKTQNYRGYHPAEVKKIVALMKVTESIEELLAALD
jgi:hypothetical protein